MSDKPVRLKLSRARGFDLRSVSIAENGLEAVNVARPGKWGNPFIVGKNGDRSECVKLYATLLSGLICLSADTIAQKKALECAQKNISALRGKNLACWCAIDGKPCHADILLEVANRTLHHNTDTE